MALHGSAVRLMDVAGEKNDNFNPIFGMAAVPLMTLSAALAVACESPSLATINFAGSIFLATRFAQQKLDEGDDPHGLTEQEIAAVHFYTQEGPFYPALNAALRDADRAALKPFFPYLKLVITALHKLPRVRDSVYRGIKLAITDLGQYEAG